MIYNLGTCLILLKVVKYLLVLWNFHACFDNTSFLSQLVCFCIWLVPIITTKVGKLKGVGIQLRLNCTIIEWNYTCLVNLSRHKESLHFVKNVLWETKSSREWHGCYTLSQGILFHIANFVCLEKTILIAFITVVAMGINIKYDDVEKSKLL